MTKPKKRAPPPDGFIPRVIPCPDCGTYPVAVDVFGKELFLCPECGGVNNGCVVSYDLKAWNERAKP